MFFVKRVTGGGGGGAFLPQGHKLNKLSRRLQDDDATYKISRLKALCFRQEHSKTFSFVCHGTQNLYGIKIFKHL